MNRLLTYLTPTTLVLTACGEDPVAPEPCAPPDTIEAIVGHPVRQAVCFATSGDAVSYQYQVTSSDTGVVTVTIADTTLTVTGQSEGTARITVTATGSDGGEGTAIYPVVVKLPWEGEITECVAEFLGGNWLVVVAGWARANISLVNVVHGVYMGDLLLQEDDIGKLNEDDRIDFGISTWVEELSGGDECRQTLEYEVAEE
ncbi:MAG: Ig-like domain-containing protein [Gemmatimonadota bacterium]|nr:Ig-like domain-containing protein [Gemmatimonadota bacterium]MDE2871825.1 Ig-like domain-containing protein [Gemmatimonadota bacterium]